MFTPAQVKAIQTWTEQRDALLREIGIFSTESGEVQKKLKEEGLSLEDIHNQIAEARGRLAELNALEERWRTSVSTDIHELEVRKSRLEGEVVAENLKLKSAEEKYALVTSATTELSSAHVIMTDQAAIVNRVVGEIIETSQTHISGMKIIMTEIKTVSDQVIEKGNENVRQTGIVLEKLPRYIFELQKPIPLRKTFHAPQGAVIAPDTTAKSEE